MSKRLRRLVSGVYRLLKIGDGPKALALDGCRERCCGATDLLYPMTECCDGTPKVWVSADRFEKCELRDGGYQLKYDGKCWFVNPNLGEKLQTLIDRGETIINTGTFECADGCNDPTCRECPYECCLTYFRQECDGAWKCCHYGSRVRMTVTEQTRKVITGTNACFLQTGCTQCFSPTSTVPIRRVEATIRTSTCDFGRDPAFNCVDTLFNAISNVQTQIDQFESDSITIGTCNAQYVNPRQTTTNDSYAEAFCPDPNEILNKPPQWAPPDADGGFVVPCNDEAEDEQPPCDGSSSTRRSQYGTYTATGDCFEGERLYYFEKTVQNCCPGCDDVVTVYERSIRYTFEILSTEGCEVDTCIASARCELPGGTCINTDPATCRNLGGIAFVGELCVPGGPSPLTTGQNVSMSEVRDAFG